MQGVTILDPADALPCDSCGARTTHVHHTQKGAFCSICACGVPPAWRTEKQLTHWIRYEHFAALLRGDDEGTPYACGAAREGDAGSECVPDGLGCAPQEFVDAGVSQKELFPYEPERFCATCVKLARVAANPSMN
jgi:hypothetical protein